MTPDCGNRGAAKNQAASQASRSGFRMGAWAFLSILLWPHFILEIGILLTDSARQWMRKTRPT